jgi:superfamily II DNA helicase RecQ
MNSLEEGYMRFQHFPEYKILVCVDCRTAVIPGQWETHIARKHPEMPTSTRKATVCRNNSISMLAQTADEVVYPDRTSDRVAGLDVGTGGFRCTARPAEDDDKDRECGKIYQRLNHMQAHCRAEHGWTNARRRGGQLRRLQPASELWQAGITFQQFFRTGGFQRLFEVEAGRQQQLAASSDGGMQGLVRGIKRQREEAAKEAQRERKKEKIDGKGSRLKTDSWVRTAGWATHLQGIEREWLLQMTVLPGQDKEEERALVRACRATEDVIFRAQRASSADVVGWPAMYLLERRELGGGDRNTKPFYAGQMGRTIVKYAAVWMRVLCYIWRMEAWQGAEGERSGEEGRRKPGYRLTAEQARALRAMQELADAAEDGDGKSSDEEGSNDENSDEEDSNEEETPKADDEQLQDSVLDFLISLLDDETKDDAYKNALISGLGVWGMDERGGWKSALQYTTDLSAIVTVSKMLVLYRANRTRTGRIEQLVAGGMGRVEAADAAPAHVDLVRDMARRFMLLAAFDGQPSPMDTIIRLRTFGMAIRDDTAADGKVDWVGDKVLCGSISFTMGQLRGMVQGLIVRARRLLLKELLLLDVDDDGTVVEAECDKLPAIQWDLIVDNPAELRDGWNFLQDARNSWPVDSAEWLHERIADEDELRKQFVDGDEQRPVWKAARLKSYAKALDRFRGYLLVLVHLTGGQPGRATELLSIRYANGPDKSGRGVFIEDGLVAMVTGYHKGYVKRGKMKIVHRYMPREVGELVLWHLWLVQPFWELVRRIHGVRRRREAFVWEPRDEAEVRRTYGDRSKKKKRRRKIIRSEDDSETGRQEAIRAMIEAEDKEWNTDRVRQMLVRATSEWMGCQVTIQAWRHIAIAIFRRYIDDKKVQEMVNEEDDENNSKERGEYVEDEMYDLAANHSSRTANMMYGRELTESPFETMRRRRGFRGVSRQWHRLLLLGSVVVDDDKTKKRTAGVQEEMERMRKEAKAEQFRRWKQMRRTDVKAQLKSMVGPEAEFRGVQEAALRAIMHQRSPIVVVMGTGGGKSLLFMLPARCSDGVTVVVVPLISLRQDMRRRCREAGIECTEWSSEKPNEWASVVLVTPEAAVSESFANFLNRQHAVGRLDRIVVDECHVVLDADETGWRKRMLALRGLNRAQAQMVYLTATLKPSEEDEFGRLMGLATDQGLWFRAPTRRKNVEYRVVATTAEGEEDCIRQLVEAKKREYAGRGQIVVYCGTRALTQRVAELVGGVFYHSKAGSAGEKAAILKRLVEEKDQVFAATNALGLGVDAARIRVVVHVGVVRRMRDYAQESGRAGRDGLRSEAIILWRVQRDRQTGVIRMDETVREMRRAGVEEEMIEYITTKGCKRAVLDRVMDGITDGAECGDGDEACGSCCNGPGDGSEAVESKAGSEDESGSELGSELRSEQEQETDPEAEFEAEMGRRRAAEMAERERDRELAGREDELESVLEKWKIGCCWCRAGDMHGFESHGVEECPDVEAEGFREWKQAKEAEIKWQAYASCWYCGVPQALCAAWRGRTAGSGFGWERSGGVCQYAGVLAAAVFARWAWLGEDETRRIGYEQMAADGAIQQQAVEQGTVAEKKLEWWLGRRRKIRGIEGSNMCEMLLLLDREKTEEG